MYGCPASCAACRAASASLNTTRAHPNALASALLLARRRVQAVGVTKLHVTSVTVATDKTGERCADGVCDTIVGVPHLGWL